MTFIQAIILGVIQGLTEFLPVSSSAHLALFPYWFNWELSEEQIFLFGVLVQMGTLGAVILYFWKDIWAIARAFFSGIAKRDPFETADSRMGWFLIIATIPAGIAGLLVKDEVEQAFSSPRLIAIFLLITAALLLLGEKIGAKTKKVENMTWKDALWMGLAQMISIFPGISRSGSTITGGLIRNLSRKDASRFSFLMSIPIMAAAGCLSLVDLLKSKDVVANLPPLIIATLVAAITGFFSIKWMLKFIQKKPFTIFSIYCATIAILTLIISFARG